jgi:hypothetical protein
MKTTRSGRHGQINRFNLLRRAAGLIWLLFLGLGAAAASVPPAAPGPVESPAFKTAQAAEQKGDVASALLGYETLYDSTITDEATRAALRAKFAVLRPKVPPNRDPGKAGAWKVRAFAFRELDFTWKDKRGTNHHARHRYRADEIERLRRSMAGFAERVWEYSDGNLRIDWALKVIDQPLTRLDGEHSFWPGPEACMPYLAEIKASEADTLMVFAKAWSDPKKEAATEGVPEMLLGGALGATEFTKEATYIGFNWGSGAVEDEPEGEPMLHEWLHSAQWTLEDYQGYPRGLMFTSGGGKMEGDAGGDLCYRRKKSEPSWMGFYQHLMRDHVTRRMWREITLQKGENQFLMKVANGYGGWAAILRLTDRNGGPLPGLSYLVP